MPLAVNCFEIEASLNEELLFSFSVFFELVKPYVFAKVGFPSFVMRIPPLNFLLEFSFYSQLSIKAIFSFSLEFSGIFNLGT